MSRIIRYLREVRTELRKVLWPTRRDTVVFTAVVIVSVAVVSLAIWVVDSLLSQILALIL